MKLLRIFFLFIFLFPWMAEATLSVKVNEPKKAGDKAVIKLTLKNTFAEKIESARAVIFLINDEGKVVGQATRWVIGGSKDKPALEPGKEITFNFVVSAEKPFTKTKLTFSRIILQGGMLADVNKDVQIKLP